MAADGTGGTTTGPTVLDGLDSNKKINLEDYYSIQGQLGKGGQGTVYLAQVKDNQEFVALKKLAHSKMSRHAFRQLKAEVNAMEELKSVPNIIKIKYVHWRASQMKTQGRVPVSLIASEVARGHLMNYMRQLGAFDEDITRHFARQLLNGLKACHTKGIYHRDLKPENLLLSSDFDLLITDFGLAAMMDAKAATHLCVTPCGTRSYKPPEVRDAEGAARDGRAAYDPEKYDVWSAVIVIFIMFAGFAPLKEASSADWWFARLAERNYGKFWEAHNQFIPGHTFPRAFMDLVEAGLHVDPAKRATVDDLLAAEWMQGATVDPKVVQADMRRRYDAFTKPLVRDVAASSNPAEIDLLGGGVTRGDGADPAPPLPAPTAGVSWLATHANWSFVSGHSDDVMGDVTAALASWPAGVVDVTHGDSTPASALLTFPGGAVLGLQLYSQPDAVGVLVCSVCVPDESAGEEAGASWDLDAELEGGGKEEEKEAEHASGVPAWTDLEGLATEVSVFLAGQLVSPDATAGEAAGKLVATGGTGAHLAVPPSPPSV